MPANEPKRTFNTLEQSIRRHSRAVDEKVIWASPYFDYCRGRIMRMTRHASRPAFPHRADACSPAPLLESEVPGITSSVAGAWYLIVAAIALQLTPSDAYAMYRSAQRYVQNDAFRTQPSVARKYPQAQGPAKVYLLRGLLNVFSLGMDDLASKLQADGISATVMNHADADLVTSQIVTTYNAGDHGPVVLIGHSLGADAIVEIADALAQYNIPVSLLVLYDGTQPHQVPANVATAINYTKHFMIAPGTGSRGIVSNVDLSGDPGIDHLSIDTAPALQSQTLNYILQATSAVPREPASRRR
jgi:hypothetical protein